MLQKYAIALVAGAACAMTMTCILRPASADDAAARPVNPYSGNKQVAEEGASLFNQYCSHCHGQWADQAERPRDLRRLKLCYGDDMIVTFYTTVQNGRMDKGMPVWKGVLPDDTLWRIYSFLETVQVDE